MSIEHHKLERLKEEICQRFGRKISNHGDVVELADKIPQSALSTQTIKRFFGLIKGNTKPSPVTLNALSNYLGYSSWDGFKDRSSLNLYHEIQRTPAGEGLDYYIKDIPSYWEVVFYKSRDKAAEIYKKGDSDYIVHFFEELGKIKNAHDTFWEWFPNLNLLKKKYYRNGLVSYRNAKNTNNAHCYANGMLFLGSYLYKNEEEAEHLFGLLNNLDDTSDMSPLPMARRMAALTIWRNHAGENIGEIKNNAVKEYLRQQENELNRYTNSYASIFIEYLIIGGMPQLISELLDLGYYPFNYSEFFASSVHYHEIRTIEALALAITGQMESSKIVFIDIIPEKYSFNDNQYYDCLYSILAVIHGNEDYRIKLSKLIAQTGYTRFYDLLELYYVKK